MALKWLGWLTLAALVTVNFWGCARVPGQVGSGAVPDSDARETPAVDLTAPVDPKLVEAQNRFGFELLSQLQQETPQENRVLSPLSVSMALSMAQAGAAGTTLDAMKLTLNLQGMEVTAVNDAIATQIAILEAADPDTQLELANSLWAKAGGIDLKPDFVDIAKSAYRAEVQVLDFSQPSALQTINSWVERATAGKIPGILDEIIQSDVLFLLNAVYFKGAWQSPFDPSQTREEPFYQADGSTTNRPLMSQFGDFSYTEAENFQAVNLPYGNGRLSMVVVLPKTEAALAELQTQLTADTWQQWRSEFRQRPGNLKLPRFQMEYGVGLNEPLKDLGLGIAFDPDQANFSNLSDASTFISEVKHKTFIEVNEAGTEAAGATSIGISVTSAPIQQPLPFVMTVNRPFFLAIQDQVSGSILFMGWVMDPTS
ncbi:serpin family protein [Pseudanabaena sp. FACHB-2040]|uniref:serpin family protein n=1 Tax=Pseudanabaena sp. FACHB-2040 TaxID=2692859 RepID=UPI001682C74D|nr:serpin family protein [Pseudanabaena sp. FACHB-2040]MBD2258556.1 serpin family protein [Pseudanabaena sp. FACHB-2040]